MAIKPGTAQITLDTEKNKNLRIVDNECVRVVSLKTVDSSWNVMAYRDAREGKWRGVWRMEWVASTLHTTSEHGVSNITTAEAHASAASSQLKWRPSDDLNGLVLLARKTKSGFCACAITFQLASPSVHLQGRNVNVSCDCPHLPEN